MKKGLRKLSLAVLVVVLSFNSVFADLAGTVNGIIQAVLDIVVPSALLSSATMAIGGTVLAIWSGPLAFLFFIVLPYIALYVIIYGFLSEIRIFRSRSVNLILALTISLFTFFVPLPVFGVTNPIFYVLLSFLLGSMGIWATLIFTLMFFVGTWYLYSKRRARWGTEAGVYSAYREEAKALSAEIRNVNESLGEAMRRLARETDPTKRASLEKSVQELTDRRNDLSERISELDRVRRRL